MSAYGVWSAWSKGSHPGALARNSGIFDLLEFLAGKIQSWVLRYWSLVLERGQAQLCRGARIVLAIRLVMALLSAGSALVHAAIVTAKQGCIRLA